MALCVTLQGSHLTASQYEAPPPQVGPPIPFLLRYNGPPKPPIKVTKPKPVAKGTYGGQCLPFARNYLHITQKAFSGYAGRVKPNSQIPAVGSVVLTSTHAAVITAMTDTELVLIESNWHLDGRVTVGRKQSIDDSSIRGYFIP